MPVNMLSPLNVVDVRNHGALGNGTSDDTDAILAAIATINNAYVQSVNTGIKVASAPVLFFPHGIYLIRQTIEFNEAGAGMQHDQIKIVGENSIIMPLPATPGQTGYTGTTAFKFNESFDIRLQELNFIGFPETAVHIHNGNLNSAQVSIESCEFHLNAKALHIQTGSTEATVEKCKFFHNRMAIDMNGGDQLTIRDCWIESISMEQPGQSPTLRPAQIENLHAYVLVESTMFIPAEVPGDVIEPAWINNRNGSITCNRIRQGGENGGITLINNFSTARPTISGYDVSAIIVKDSQCYCFEDATLRPTILRYVDAIPNMTVIRNNRGMIDGRIMNFSRKKYDDFIAANPGSTLSFEAYAQQYIVATSMNNGDPSGLVPVNVVVEVANNIRGIPHGNGTQIPTPLLPFVRDKESLWSAKSNVLPYLSKVPLINGGQQYGVDYTFEFPADMSHAMFLVRYSANPWMIGSGIYSGGYAGFLKVNGAHYNGITGWFIELKELFNKVGDDSASFINGTFSVTTSWDQGTIIDPDGNPATPNSFSILPYDPNLTAAQRRFTIRITGTTGNDDIELISLQSLAY